MKFARAIEYLLAGKRISRQMWIDDFGDTAYGFELKDQKWIVYKSDYHETSGREYDHIRIVDLLANDWLIVRSDKGN